MPQAALPEAAGAFGFFESGFFESDEPEPEPELEAEPEPESDDDDDPLEESLEPELLESLDAPSDVLVPDERLSLR